MANQIYMNKVTSVDKGNWAQGSKRTANTI
jgi:hypothetical protein